MDVVIEVLQNAIASPPHSCHLHLRDHVEVYVSLGLALSVYRNLRENYEFRLRYDDAGEFFKKEMELKRKYREIRAENVLRLRKMVGLEGIFL